MYFRNYTSLSLLSLNIFCFLIFLLFNELTGNLISTSLLVGYSLFIVILEAGLIVKKTSNILSPALLFFVSFCLFQSGQIYLTAFNIDYNDFYIQYLGYLYDDAALFSSLSNIIAGIAAIFVLDIRTKSVSTDSRFIPDIFNYTNIFAYKGACICGLCAVPLIIIKFTIVLQGGYNAVRIFETGIHPIINFLEYLFFPFCLLFVIYESDSVKSFVVKRILLIWLILTALCGDRTTGVSGILILYIVNQSKSFSLASFCKVLICTIGMIVFIQFAYLFRTQSDITGSFENINNMVISFIAELGFSSFPLFAMMDIVPSTIDFQYGINYLYSFVGGMIPSFIDPIGLIKTINNQSRMFEEWYTRYYSQFSFGLGYSLNAEAYVNFGWYGLCAIFVECTIIFYMLTLSFNNDSKWSKYVSLVLLFMWMTLPRRDSYYIWKAISYCVVFVWVYIKMARTYILRE